AFFRNIDRSEPELGRLADRVARKGLVLVPLGGARSECIRGKLARQLLDLELVVGEVELGHRAGALGAAVLVSKSPTPPLLPPATLRSEARCGPTPAPSSARKRREGSASCRGR